ncbi:hypothetical protein D0Z00_002790 [Geotrichum galactomycetum]|uniref:Uncharacterized protein n=1 Tax=Geotrichum galactomycetum TaxID=27317 RepID=A0ACB6V352_9ASCO|nr:hypothetical protein D0Z00_002790 [Geotrichum candidum]
MRFLSTVSTLAALTSVAIAAVPEIVIDGNKFFYSNNGTQFFMKGVAYQQELTNATSGATFSDPLADPEACKRDLPYLLQLETNLLRVYAINTTLDHSDCINLFADNGIYIIADLSEPGLSINRDEPSWTVELFNRYTTVIDELQGFPSVLGFFAGNEVTNNNTNTDASPFVKAAIRDTKAYIKDKGYRAIPVGYSTNDDEDTRGYLADYFSCDNSENAADFYGINMYEWCGTTVNFQTSGYADRTKEFENFTIPVFFSEYGCNVPQPRTFADVPSLYSSNMTDTWSGGIVYMYFEEANNYGLVTIQADNSVSTLRDFTYLSSRLANVSPSGVNSNSWKPSNTVQRACPASTLADWKGSSDLPPVPNQGVCNCMFASLSCIVDTGVNEEDYQTLFDYVCSQVSCDGITANGTTGSYGAYSFCSPAEKLSFVLNLYYKKIGSRDACNFSGSAKLASASSTASSCSAVLSQAGKDGTGAVSASVTGSFTGNAEAGATGKATGSSGNSAAASSGSTSSATSSSADKSAASHISIEFGGVKAITALVASVIFGVVLVL